MILRSFSPMRSSARTAESSCSGASYDRSGFGERLQKEFSVCQFDGDCGSLRITLPPIDTLLIGGAHMRHLGMLERDPLFLRFTRLHRLPTDRTVSNTFKETTSAVRDRLGKLRVAASTDTQKRIRKILGALREAA